MIGRSCDDGTGAIDLFGQHHPRQGVRPGLDAKGQGLIARGDKVGIKAVGPADNQHQPAHPVIAQARKVGGEIARGPGLAALVAGDDIGAGQMSAQGLRLGGLAGFLRLDLDDVDGSERQGPAGGRSAFGIIRGERRFRRAAQLADGEQAYLQLAPAARWGLSTAQIFSML